MQKGGITTVLGPLWDDLRAPCVVRRTEDTSGNQVLYTWVGNRLESIVYGGTNEDPAAFPVDETVPVDLQYETRPLGERRYHAGDGHLDVIEDRLVRIEVATDPEGAGFSPALAFDLWYDADPDTGEEHLDGVTWTDLMRPGAATRTLVELGYTPLRDSATFVEASTDPELIPPFLSIGSTFTEWATGPSHTFTSGALVDLSGDGLLDALYQFTGGWQWIDGGGGPRLGWADGAYDTRWEDYEARNQLDVVRLQGHDYARSDVMGIDDYASFQQHRVLDVDGDGLVDLVTSAAPTPVEWSSDPEQNIYAEVLDLARAPTTWTVAYGTDDGFSVPEVETAPFLWSRISRHPNIPWTYSNQFAGAYWSEGDALDLRDMNGDGFADLVFVGSDPETPGVGNTFLVWPHLGVRGAGWAPEPVTFDTELLGDSFQVAIVDPPFASMMQSWGTPQQKEYQLPDYDVEAPVLVDSHVVTTLQDLNGDGLPDLVHSGDWTPADPTWRVWLGTGAGFAAPVDWPAPIGDISKTLEGRPEVTACRIDDPDPPEPLDLTQLNDRDRGIDESGGCST